MNTTEKSKSILFIDYIPAVLRENKDWIIVFRVFNPLTNKLDRKRYRVPKTSKVSERRKLASRMIFTINNKLENGWNPILEDEAPKALTLIVDTLNSYLRGIKRDAETGEIRNDTIVSYTSVINSFRKFLIIKSLDKEYIINFKTSLISDYLDYIYLEKELSPTTHNNHLAILKIFTKYLLQKGYIKSDPTTVFQNKKKKEKKRGVIEKQDINIIFSHLDQNFKEFSLLSKLLFYCYIRPTEISKLKVGDINIQKQLIYISEDVAKKSFGYVTIPSHLINEVANHIKSAKVDDYIFSLNQLLPGQNMANRKFYYRLWIKHVVNKKLTNQPFYSLKDSGITLALDNSVSTASVMNQARHKDLTITTKYIRKNQHNADINIKDSNW